jgi:hypothetical protein
MEKVLVDLQEKCYNQMLENERFNPTRKLETFEVYADRMKSKMLKKTNDYVHSLHNGYEVLIKRIQEKRIADIEENL